LVNDPELRVALKEKESADAYQGINRSFLLPNISYNYSRYKNNYDQSLVNDPQGNNSITNLEYFSSVNQLTVSQTIFNFSQFANYKKGIAQAALGIENYRSRSYQLADRLMTTYFDTLFIHDQIEAIQAQIKAYSEQLKINKKLYDLGQGTKTDILETQSRLEIAESSLFGYQSNLEQNYRKISSITGIKEGDLRSQLNRLNKKFVYLESGNFKSSDLIASALNYNPDIAAAKKNQEVYLQELRNKQGAFMPSLIIQGNLGTTQSQYVTQFNQQYTGSSIGLVLNVPIFTGGYNYYNIKQSQSNLEIAQAQFDLKKEKIAQEILKGVSLLASLKNQIQSLLKAEESIEFLKESSKKSFLAGYKTNLDILNAEQLLQQNKKDIAQAKYEYLLAFLRLKIAEGTLNQTDFADIEKNLQSNK
jgi:protease secretion system outer membrane protein